MHPIFPFCAFNGPRFADGPSVGGLGLSQTLKTEQTLSPQMLQSLALLQMPIMELKAHIQSEIEANPALEIPDSEFGDTTFTDGLAPTSLNAKAQNDSASDLEDTYDDADSSDYEAMSYTDADGASLYESTTTSDHDATSYASYDPNADPDASDRKQSMLENSSAPGESLQDHLLQQLGETPLPEHIRPICEALISNLDPNGFFILPLDQLLQNLPHTQSDLDTALATVQSFDPAGICVADFRQSLILQAKLAGMAPEDLAHFAALVNRYLDKLKAGKFREIATALAIPEEDVRTLYDILRGLTPYPGRTYSADFLSTIQPDFSIHARDGQLILDLNRADIPTLEISPDFQALADNLHGPSAKQTSTYIRSCLTQARSLITQVNLRFQTLYKAAAALMDLQRPFFLNGPRYLKPMTLKDIADIIGVHETTMSRLSQSKWVETDWGLYQLKYFFTQGVSNTSAAPGAPSTISRNVVKDMIAEIIAENGSLSDQKISDILLSRGIKCARRTVSKYRAELNIDSSYTR